ncbi:chromophore lyase CpcT/CpeT [Prochlorothrix hollandica]|uniref:Chromophore lyase CpcT/CpeT n=1 Tax=Prochlorothrix hollandica PCC 9006 = CALU 1027 TaxID=317619 RepID=A0A0M2PQE6_PROHO|nr:chromophore lyase CpcT/CpeT [Prochlorothrix hollandica]KKI98454.1 hypothetical protein PROH_18550 [Prochlorothrix hollandica PCC 9006 = CALU 1027]
MATVTPHPDLVLFAQWLAGAFSNGDQVAAHPGRYGRIELVFRPLPQGFGEHLGFYGEQAYGYHLDRPYRQVVHRLLWRDNGIEVENYRLPNPQDYVGAGQDPERLRGVRLESLLHREGCSMVFRREGDRFVGQLANPGQCLVPWEGRETYLVSEAVLREGRWTSRDRGFSPDDHQQVWGSVLGSLEFVKVMDFSGDIVL